MFNIFIHQLNSNQNDFEISFYSRYNGHDKKIRQQQQQKKHVNVRSFW